ncbi:MAG: four-helix bundle copper-binding protein [Verrucomicrobia bacterium]|nr:four-helix bundle copper-binding protein [Verrucomicrobiota bacterium]
MNPEMHESIHRCEDCHDACLHAVHDCLKKGGEHAEAHHIGMLLDCAQMCRTAHDFMIRHSHLHPITCAACAQICQACADACDKLGHAELAAICRSCAESCLKHAQEKTTH